MSDKKTMMLDDLTVLREENERLRDALQYEAEKTESQRVLDIALRLYIRAAVAVDSARERFVDRFFPESWHRHEVDSTDGDARDVVPMPVEEPRSGAASEKADEAPTTALPVIDDAEKVTPKRSGHAISRSIAPPSRVKLKGSTTVPDPRLHMPERPAYAPITISKTDWSHRIVKRGLYPVDVAAPWTEVASEATNEAAEAKMKAITHEADTLYRIVVRGDVIMSTWTKMDGALIRLPYPDKHIHDADLDWVSGWERKWDGAQMLERSQQFFSQRDQWRAVKACLAHKYVASAERDACVSAWDAHFESGAAVLRVDKSKDYDVGRVLQGDLSFAMYFSGERDGGWRSNRDGILPDEFREIVRRELSLESLLRSLVERRIEKRPLSNDPAAWESVSVVRGDDNAERALRSMEHTSGTLYRVMHGNVLVSMWVSIDGGGIVPVPRHGCHVVSKWFDATNAYSMIQLASGAISISDRWGLIRACLSDGYFHTPERDAFIAQQDEFFASGTPVNRVEWIDSIDEALVVASAGWINEAIRFANEPPQGSLVNYTSGTGSYWSITKKASDDIPSRYTDIVRRELTLPMVIRALVAADKSA